MKQKFPFIEIQLIATGMTGVRVINHIEVLISSGVSIFHHINISLQHCIDKIKVYELVSVIRCAAMN